MLAVLAVRAAEPSPTFLSAYLSPTGLLWAVVNSERIPTSALVSAIEVPG